MGNFGSVDVSLLCGAGRDFRSNDLGASVSNHWSFGKYFRTYVG